MYPHHQNAIGALIPKFETDPSALSLLLTGSIAHGTASESSDVDLTVIINNEAFEKRQKASRLTSSIDLSDLYEGGYADAKFVARDFLEEVAKKGSEPSRYAFLDSQVLFDRTQKIPELIEAITRYPVERKEENLKRFYAQLEAWNWYCYEALKHENAYLLDRSVANLILFGGRIVLTLGETLYPYHKWFLHVLSKAPAKPARLMENIDSLLSRKGEQEVKAFYECIKDIPVEVRLDHHWPHQFMVDSELNWLEGNTPVADL